MSHEDKFPSHKTCIIQSNGFTAGFEYMFVGKTEEEEFFL